MFKGIDKNLNLGKFNVRGITFPQYPKITADSFRASASFFMYAHCSQATNLLPILKSKSEAVYRKHIQTRVSLITIFCWHGYRILMR